MPSEAVTVSSAPDSRPRLGSDSPLCADVPLVRAQLDRILGCEQFRTSTKLSSFLRYVTEAALEGRASEIKETSIGVAVYGRSPSYDPKLDTVVRTEARRLRQKLDRYFEEEGKQDSVRITLPKGGYVPVFHVQPQTLPSLEDKSEVKPVPEPEALEELSLQPTIDSSRFRAAPILMVIAVLVAALLGVIFLQQPRAKNWAASSRISPLTSFLGEANQPNISPDGKSVAFIWNEQGAHYNIYVVQDGGRPLRVTSSNGTDTHPVWSPDGTELAFLRFDGTGAHVMSAVFPGGAEKLILNLRNSRPWGDDQLAARNDAGPSWMPDGKAVVVSDTAPSGSGLGLYRIDRATRTEQPLTQPPVDERDLNPVVSPDGHWIAFSRFSSYDSADIFVLPLPNGSERRLTDERKDVQGLTWEYDSRRLVFSSNRSGAYALWSINLHDSRIESIPSSGESAIQPSLSRDSSTIVYVDSSMRSQLAKVESPAVSGRETQWTVISPSTRRSHSGQFSPDGSRVAFVSDRNGKWELWVADADGTSANQLTNFGASSVGSPRWSPDGRQIAFDARPDGHSAIFVVSENGYDLRNLSPTGLEEKQPAWSPDGKWIYFDSNRTGKMHLSKMRNDGSEFGTVADVSATDPRFAPEGRTILYTTATSGLWSLDLKSGQSSLLPGTENALFSRLWTVADGGVYFIDALRDRKRLMFYDLLTQRQREVLHLPAPPLLGYPSLSYSPSEHTFLFATKEDVRSDLMEIRSAR